MSGLYIGAVLQHSKGGDSHLLRIGITLSHYFPFLFLDNTVFLRKHRVAAAVLCLLQMHRILDSLRPISLR